MTRQTSPASLVPVKLSPFNAESALEELEPEVTPTEGFYVRSNFKVPSLSATAHRVTVAGNVERPLELGLDDLRRLGTRTLLTTMECAGNNRMSLAPLPSGEPWLGGAISTGQWTGTPLVAVLDAAGIRGGTVEILVEGADRGKPADGPPDIPFARALPLEWARREDTILAFEMNGQPLPTDHGAPLRLIVPAWYGMASVKWVGRVEALTEPFAGYYQKRRYVYDYTDGREPTPVTTMLVKSTITSPRDGEVVPTGRRTVRGRAWSGSGPIEKVEVTVDGGENWQPARLRPAPSPYGWQAFEYDWDAEGPGRHALRARATDSAGNVQPPIARWNKYGYGSNGVQVISVNVR
jgi:DMSO/TMAO reductase YedYZ molybdopterin-dependent catalytic subunit